jgi:putative ABC transport system permease protein
MFRNYFKTAWRNIRKEKGYSFINIAGLSLGIAVALLIGLWIYDEVSFNKNFDNHDRIAQVIQNVTNNGERQTWKNIPYPLAEELRKNYGSDFKQVVLVDGFRDHMLKYEDKKLAKTGGFFEKGGPELFSLEMLKGSRGALSDPSSVLLSASAAKAYFGDTDPINKLMKIDEWLTVKVAGIYQDFPANSSLANLSFFASWDLLYANSDWIKAMSDPWRPNAFALFVLLNDNADINAAAVRIKDAKLKKVNEQLAKKKPELLLHPMKDWHLRAEFDNGKNIGGAIKYVWMFGIIGVFVLLLACINFMNLSTARSEKRAKEVGIRKTLGSLRKQLIFQFFSESFLTIIFAFAFAVILAALVIPFFNTLAGKIMRIPWGSAVFWIVSLVFIFITGLVAGSYPAFYLSSFRPIKVLKGTFKAGRFAAVPRKVLVTLQFTVSVTLIIGTIIVYQQIKFAKNRPVGYSRENLVFVPAANQEIHKHIDAVRDQLLKTGVVTAVAESNGPTVGLWGSTSGLSWPGKDPNLSTDVGTVDVSYDYGKTVGWQIKEGRDFSRQFATDSSAIVINEAALALMNLTAPIGKTITWWNRPYTLIGIAGNMVMNSPYDEPSPAVFSISNDASSVAMIRIKPEISASEAIARIAPVFKHFNPDQPFDYRFTDEEYNRKFENEERIGKLAGFFALLAIIISCLGLFGLTSFVAEQRTKEISIRKILGASTFTIWNLLSKDFMVLVLLSFLVAVPLSWYFMNGWLQGYTYRTSMSWWIFAVAGAGSVVVTILTVSFQAIKAAMANPVKSLRTE